MPRSRAYSATDPQFNESSLFCDLIGGRAANKNGPMPASDCWGNKIAAICASLVVLLAVDRFLGLPTTNWSYIRYSVTTTSSPQAALEDIRFAQQSSASAIDQWKKSKPEQAFEEVDFNKLYFRPSSYTVSTSNDQGPKLRSCALSCPHPPCRASCSLQCDNKELLYKVCIFQNLVYHQGWLYYLVKGELKILNIGDSRRQ